MPGDTPLTVARLAWKDLIEHLMAERRLKKPSHLYKALNDEICYATARRWLGEQPPVPEYESLKKVADWIEAPVSKVERMWTYFIVQRCEPYPIEPVPADEIAEPAPEYDAADLVIEAQQVLALDLKNVPPDLSPPLHQMRVEIIEHIEQTLGRLRMLISRYRELYSAAVSTALKTRLPS